MKAYCPICKEFTRRRKVRLHDATWHICDECDTLLSISYEEEIEQ
jgi:hypothetical protein